MADIVHSAVVENNDRKQVNSGMFQNSGLFHNIEVKGNSEMFQNSELETSEMSEVFNTNEVFGNMAPSCALLFDDKHDGDIIVHEICVPSKGSAKYTNYCCLQWNGGRNGQGCCGILDHPEGKCFFFSLFEPPNSKEPIISTFKGDGTFTEIFGDTGLGLKSMNFQLRWKPDRWYTIVLRTWNVDGNSTHFGCWVEDQQKRIWTHLITMKFPVPGICFSPSTSCFLEDWHGNGKTVRCVWFKNGYKRLLDKSWAPFSVATFVINQNDSSKNYNENYDAGCHDNVFYMQTGSTTSPAPGLKPGAVLSRLSTPQPHRSLITFNIIKAENDRVEWDVAKSTPPQFHFALMGSNANQTEARGTVLWAPKADVTVTLEDIFGRRVSKTTKIT